MDDKELKEKLTPEQYRVLRQKGAENPFSGKYWDSEEEGVYACAACGAELFSSEDKFDSETGFPSFKKALDSKTLELFADPDSSDGFNGLTTGRLEVRCKNCASHLGYVINGEEKYYRLNSASLELNEKEDEEEDEEEEKNSKKDSGKLKKATSILKAMTLAAATTAVGAVIGARAGFLICQNTKSIENSSATQQTTTKPVISTTPSPRPKTTGLVSTPASPKTPLLESVVVLPIETPSSTPPTETPTPPADGITP